VGANMIILTIGTSNWDSLLQLIGVSILFIFILAITYFTTKFVGGTKLNQVKNSNFQVIETYKLTQNKYLQIIKIGSRYFVIAIGKDNIQNIAELDEKDILIGDSLKPSMKFSDVISMISNKKEKKQNDDQEDDHK
jgi:flagellar protein FliO/FliZ